MFGLEYFGEVSRTELVGSRCSKFIWPTFVGLGKLVSGFFCYFPDHPEIDSQATDDDEQEIFSADGGN